MKLREVFSQLTYGELSQLSIGGGEVGEISEKNYPPVISHINLGLMALYKRFTLKEGRVTVGMSPSRFTYVLKSRYAVSNTTSSEPEKYLLDTAEPFQDDILKVERVYTANGWEMGLNDLSNAYAIMTPSATVLRVPPAIVLKSLDLPEELQTSTLEVVYRASHPHINLDASGFDPLDYELELPYSHLEPLLLFVASRVNNPIGMVNEFNAGNNYAAKYEQACQALETQNLRVDQGAQPDRLQRNGWV